MLSAGQMRLLKGLSLCAMVGLCYVLLYHQPSSSPYEITKPTVVISMSRVEDSSNNKPIVQEKPPPPPPPDPPMYLGEEDQFTHHGDENETETQPEEFQDVRLRYSLLRKSFMDPDQKFSAAEQLNETFVPTNVHYMWCGQRHLEFKKFLSIMSVLREIRPDKIVFHYEDYPTVDKVYYNLWLDELKYEYPFLVMSKMDDYEVKYCVTHRPQKIHMVMEILNKEGGIYISEDTWMLNFDPHRRDVDLEFSLQAHTMNGYIILRRGVYGPNMTYGTLLENTSYVTRSLDCAQVHHIFNGENLSPCLNVRGGRYDSNFYPMNIWDLNNEFGRIARRIFYGTSEIRKPVPSYDELVPNIGHMIWIGGGKMDFVFYLSALSVLYVLNVDMLYIHGDQEPAGDYWPQLKQNPRVKYVLRPTPNLVYQGEIAWYYRSLMSDIIRCDIMIKYGGIYTDTDAIWVKPLTYEERGYDAVASYDWIDWSYPYPDSVNMGLSYGKKSAPFWQLFRDSMRILHNTSPGYTGVQMPYKLLEKYPHLLRIDRHLSVICYKFRCHPTWVKNYHDIKNDHVTSNSIPNWREDVHAFHWTHPNPPEYANMTTLLNSTGVFADLAKNVLEKAGLLPDH